MFVLRIAQFHTPCRRRMNGLKRTLFNFHARAYSTAVIHWLHGMCCVCVISIAMSIVNSVCFQKDLFRSALNTTAAIRWNEHNVQPILSNKIKCVWINYQQIIHPHIKICNCNHCFCFVKFPNDAMMLDRLQMPSILMNIIETCERKWFVCSMKINCVAIKLPLNRTDRHRERETDRQHDELPSMILILWSSVRERMSVRRLFTLTQRTKYKMYKHTIRKGVFIYIHIIIIIFSHTFLLSFGVNIIHTTAVLRLRYTFRASIIAFVLTFVYLAFVFAHGYVTSDVHETFDHRSPNIANALPQHRVYRLCVAWRDCKAFRLLVTLHYLSSISFVFLSFYPSSSFASFSSSNCY